MPLSPEAERYAFAWGAIESAVGEYAPTGEIFAAVQAVIDEEGRGPQPGLFKAVNELRSLAVQQRNAADRFQAADPGSLFTNDFAPLEINARSVEDRSLFPEILARFDMTVQNAAGEIEETTKTMRASWLPGWTVRDVTAEVAESAMGLAERYGVSYLSHGNIRIVSI